MAVPKPAGVVIQLVLPQEASNAPLISEIATLVNEVYLEGESGFFVETRLRTDTTDVKECIQSSEIYTATSQDGQIIGCVKLHIEESNKKAGNKKVGHLGMFAVASSQRRSGLGRKLIDFVEKEARSHGCQIMELEVLMPKEGGHVFKDFLKVWYPKLGYRPVRTEEIADVLPFLVPDIIRPGHHVVYHKLLVEEP
jgi:GNAT superfamily N-acetyltransferase